MVPQRWRPDPGGALVRQSESRELFGAGEGIGDEAPVHEIFGGVQGDAGEDGEGGAGAEEGVVVRGFGDGDTSGIWVEAGEDGVEEGAVLWVGSVMCQGEGDGGKEGDQ